MNIEKKLEYFTEAIAREVESKKRRARQQMANDFNSAVSDGVARAKAEAEEQITAEKQEIEKAVNKRITEATTKSRRALATLREDLTEQLFVDIATDIHAFTHTPEYENYLISSIQAAQANSKHPYKFVQLTPYDMRLSDTIQIATGLTPEQAEANILGGFRLLSENRDKASEYTFQSGLAEAKHEFATQLS